MKFSVKSACSSARLGTITNVLRLPDFELETPQALLYTRSGTVPHLTCDVLEMVSTQNLGLHIPVSKITNVRQQMKLSQSNIAKYIGMNEYMTYCSFIDSCEKRKEGFHEKNKVSLWTRFGRKTYTAKEYMELIEDLKPDLFLILADGDTHSQSSKKRNIKSFNNTVKFFEQCTDLYEKSSTLKQCQMIAAVEGGFDLTLREQCSELVGKSSIFGVVLDGFHDCSASAMEIQFSDIKPILEASLKHIPTDKLRIIHGCWNPSVVLDLVEHGIDLFDSSYPYAVTEEGSALIFPVQEILNHNQVNGLNGIMEQISNNNNNSVNKIISTTKNEIDCPKRIKLSANSKYCLSLSNPSYVSDFSPILKNCTCYTCKNHTKAYIHHLLNVKEMLAQTLLMIHNLHHYLQFLATIRKSLSSGTFTELKENFQNWAQDAGDAHTLP